MKLAPVHITSNLEGPKTRNVVVPIKVNGLTGQALRELLDKIEKNRNSLNLNGTDVQMLIMLGEVSREIRKAAAPPTNFGF